MTANLLTLGAGLFALGLVGLAGFVVGSFRLREGFYLASVSVLLTLAGGLFFVNNLP